mgnify:CR=1 FL=1
MIRSILISILALTTTILLPSCGANTEEQNSQQQNEESSDEAVLVTVNENGEWTMLEEKTVAPAIVPESETFYSLDEASALKIASPITYNVDLKNYDPNDEWKTEFLSHTDRIALANAIFQAVYKGRLTPIDYFSEQPMPIDSVKAMEKRFNRSEIGQIMFTENWYFSEKDLTFTKKVESVTFGYERINLKTGQNNGFTPAFMVRLGN